VNLATNKSTVVHGWARPGFEAVVEEFQRNFSERGDSGAAFAAVVDGKAAIDLWGGYADRSAAQPWSSDTLAGIFSGSKGLVATCLLVLIDRGALDLDAPVCSYWPDFAAAGKEGILVRHLVSHQAGLPGLTTPATAEAATDSLQMARLLAAQPPLYPAGTGLHYHALTFGWLCGELVRRIDGRSVGRFFQEEVAQPLCLDAWIGLPAEHENRVSVLERGRGFGVQGRDLAATQERDQVAWSIWANPPRFTTDPLPANTRMWHAAEIPATNAIASARSLARLYGCLARGGEIDGVRLLSPSTVELGSTCLGCGVEPYLEEEVVFGVGFQLQTSRGYLGPEEEAYGHTGTGGSIHAAWPRLKTGFSYTMNVLQDGGDGLDPRVEALTRALHEALELKSARQDPVTPKGLPGAESAAE
jgi:CubicO group peptidase (beta-lactamase class C family)